MFTIAAPLRNNSQTPSIRHFWGHLEVDAHLPERWDVGPWLKDAWFSYQRGKEWWNYGMYEIVWCFDKMQYHNTMQFSFSVVLCMGHQKDSAAHIGILLSFHQMKDSKMKAQKFVRQGDHNKQKGSWI